LARQKNLPAYLPMRLAFNFAALEDAVRDALKE
jgi:hypothetical protein